MQKIGSFVPPVSGRAGTRTLVSLHICCAFQYTTLPQLPVYLLAFIFLLWGFVAHIKIVGACLDTTLYHYFLETEVHKGRT